MKTFLISLFTLLSTNAALAAPQATATVGQDGMGVGVLLLVGAVGLIIARRRTA